MTRKPLPKAITRPVNLRAIGAELVPDEEVPLSPRSANPADARTKSASEAEHDSEPALTISSLPVANDTLPGGLDSDPALAARARALADQRRALARKIIERHRTLAAVGGLCPLPVVNIASVTGIILRMVKQLSELYQLPFQRDRARAAIIGLMGGAVPTGLGTAAASTLTFVVPGGALVGLGVSALTAATLTRGIGRVFVESFERDSPIRY